MTRRLAAAVIGVLLLSGCAGFQGIYSLPLPGAAASGGHTYTVAVEFADALDLVPYSAVKVNGATVGHVVSVRLSGSHAVVRCALPDSVHLPANSIARIAQTSLLGEKFVELEPPAGAPPTGRLVDGSVLPLTQTSTDAQVEQVLGALALLLNGGGVQQVRTIARELNIALGGREQSVRRTLAVLTDFAAGLNAQKGQILQAVAGIDRLTATVRAQETAVTGALDQLPGAVTILARDRQQLTTMLVALQHLGDVAVKVVHSSQANLVANLRDLQPTLTNLAKAGSDILPSFSGFFTYPTTDGVEQEYNGDYGNLDLTIDVSSLSLLNNFGLLPQPPAGAGRVVAPGSGLPPTTSVPVQRTVGAIDQLLLGALQ